MINIVLVGHRGKMGQIAQQAIHNAPDLELIATAGSTSELANILKNTTSVVVLDLTQPSVVYTHTQMILEANCHPVIGTSGLSTTDIAQLQKKYPLGGLIVPNFSLFTVLMMHCSKLIAPYCADAAIVETHHLDKKDAPSATALSTAEGIASHRKTMPSTHASQAQLAGCLGGLAHQVPIHSLRMPGVIADQEVSFHSLGEQLTLSLTTHSRSAFAAGIVLACQKVHTLPQLTVGLESLLFT